MEENPIKELYDEVKSIKDELENIKVEMAETKKDFEKFYQNTKDFVEAHNKHHLDAKRKV